MCAAEPSARSLSSGHLQIEIEVPADHADPHNPAPLGNDSSEEEWETVGAEGMSEQPSPSDNPDSASKGRNWRERASHRQKYWSRMTGFQFGRKLGDWGKEEDPEAKISKVSVVDEGFCAFLMQKNDICMLAMLGNSNCPDVATKQ